MLKINFDQPMMVKSKLSSSTNPEKSKKRDLFKTDLKTDGTGYFVLILKKEAKSVLKSKKKFKYLYIKRYGQFNVSNLSK